LSTDAGVQIAVAVVGALFFTSHGWVVVALQPKLLAHLPACDI
jgi:hypothetical protein